MAREDWNNVYFTVIPLIGIAISAIGVAISVMMLRRDEAAGVGSLEPPSGVAVDIPRVHYQDGQILLSVRNPGEWHPITGFVQPHDPWVRQVVRQII